MEPIKSKLIEPVPIRILPEEDERLSIARPEVEELAAGLKTREKNRTEWQRVIYYLVAGSLCLAALLAIADRMNPPDSALRGQALAQVLAPWEGRWAGNVVVYDMTGRAVSNYECVRDYSSSNRFLQTVNCLMISPDGEIRNSIWVNKVHGRNQMEGKVRQVGEKHLSVYDGRLDPNGQLVWSRQEAEGVRDIVRSWISNGDLYIEEVYLSPGEPTGGYMLSGVLSRSEL